MTDDRRLEVETARRPAFGPGPPAALPVVHEIDPAVIRRRRRLVRLVGVMTLLGGIGLSAIPGPKGSADTVTHVTENGVTTTVHKFSYYRPYGVPFTVARVDIPESGRGIDRFEMSGEGTFGFFANMAVAFTLVFGASLVLGRRRDS